MKVSFCASVLLSLVSVLLLLSATNAQSSHAPNHRGPPSPPPAGTSFHHRGPWFDSEVDMDVILEPYKVSCSNASEIILVNEDIESCFLISHLRPKHWNEREKIKSGDRNRHERGGRGVLLNGTIIGFAFIEGNRYNLTVSVISARNESLGLENVSNLIPIHRVDRDSDSEDDFGSGDDSDAEDKARMISGISRQQDRPLPPREHRKDGYSSDSEESDDKLERLGVFITLVQTMNIEENAVQIVIPLREYESEDESDSEDDSELEEPTETGLESNDPLSSISGPETSSKGLTTGSVIGIVVGAAVGATLIAIVAVYGIHKMRQSGAETEPESNRLV